ncbi:MAG: hypothetical protein ABI615_07590, partial [Chthoniobacterales bacterium]
MNKYLSLVLCLLSAAAFEVNAATTYTFNSALTGGQSWSTNANWSPSTSYPGAVGTTDWAIIAPASGALTVTTPNTPTTIGSYNFTGSTSNPLTLVLGNNLSTDTITGLPAAGVWTNTSGTASNLTLDLNGHNFSAIALQSTNNYGNGTTLPSTLSMVIKSTGNAGGTFITQNYTGAAIDIQNNVTMQIHANGTIYATSLSYNLTNTTFSNDSTLQFVGGNTAAYPNAALLIVTQSPTTSQSFGTLTIGDAVTGHYTDVAMHSNINAGGVHTAVVRGDMSLVGGKVTFSLGYNYQSINNLKVGGNFTDEGGGNSTYSVSAGTNNVITFNGGAGTQKTVSINRTIDTAGVSANARHTDFTVGDATSAGNIKLVNPSTTVGALYTSGSMTVYNGSKLNLDHSTTTGNVASLKAGSIIIGATSTGGSAATIATSFGTNSGFGVASNALGGTGNLTLNSYNLELNFDGTSWTNGANLVLFTYTGT